MVATWLDDDEQRAWRLLLRATLTLVDRLDDELRAQHGISLGDYEILAHLSANAGGLRMRDLATLALVSKSRLTHTIDRLVARGLVRRRPCADDRRGVTATLTPAGRTLLERAAPDHVAGVRRHLLDHLPPTGVKGLTRALAPVLQHLQPDGPGLT